MKAYRLRTTIATQNDSAHWSEGRLLMQLVYAYMVRRIGILIDKNYQRPL